MQSSQRQKRRPILSYAGVAQQLRAGALGLLGGLGMGDLARLKAKPDSKSSTPIGGAKSVIYVFLSGGLAQHESFDMKPDAPIEKSRRIQTHTNPNGRHTDLRIFAESWLSFPTSGPWYVH